MTPSPTTHPLAVELAALARAECARPENRFGAAFADEHLAVVVDRALALAPRLGADPLAVTLAGWLHDLAAVRDLGALPVHAEAGAALAGELLRARGVAPALVERVVAACATHSFPPAPGAGTPEQACLAAADVLSHLARPAYWCFYLFKVRGLELAQGLDWLRGRAGAAFEALPPAAQALGAADRAALLRWLGPPGPVRTLAGAGGPVDDGPAIGPSAREA